MVIDHTDPFAPPAKPDPSLIKVIVNAHRFNEQLLPASLPIWPRARNCADPTTAKFSASLTSPPTSPPPSSNDDSPPAHATMLIERPHLPLSWQEQRTALGFAFGEFQIRSPKRPQRGRSHWRGLICGYSRSPAMRIHRVPPMQQRPREKFRGIARSFAGLPSLPAQPTRRCRNGPENMVFSTTRRRLSRTIESTWIGWLGD